MTSESGFLDFHYPDFFDDKMFYVVYLTNLSYVNYYGFVCPYVSMWFSIGE